MARKPGFFSTRRPKIVQSWKKQTLYNLQRWKEISSDHEKLFLRKWRAKGILRLYHGESVRETQWRRIFRSSVRSVVEIPRSLGTSDGSDIAAGRGAGRIKAGASHERPVTPYLNMIWAPLERRLDSAVFRALFASSIWQARQMVVHGLVTVNGKKMIYPGYQLNPGDLFQVSREAVMRATAAKKHGDGRIRRRERAMKRAEERAEKSKSKRTGRTTASPKSIGHVPPLWGTRTRATKLHEIIAAAKDVLAATPFSNERIVRLRKFHWLVRWRIASASRDHRNPRSVSEQMKDLVQRYRQPSGHAAHTSNPAASPSGAASNPTSTSTPPTAASVNTPGTSSETPPEPASSDSSTASASSDPTSPSPTNPQNPNLTADREDLAAREGYIPDPQPYEFGEVRQVLQELHDNPVQPGTTWLTPWRPRTFMSAFAFVPRYLEVLHSICAAVYIRHPVARSGLAEVPSPYPVHMSRLAHAWYMQHRKRPREGTVIVRQ